VFEIIFDKIFISYINDKCITKLETLSAQTTKFINQKELKINLEACYESCKRIVSRIPRLGVCRICCKRVYRKFKGSLTLNPAV